MAPVKKTKTNNSPSNDKKLKDNLQNINDSVVSGQLQKKINKRPQKPQKDAKGVVFIKHLPHGFFEEQLKKYFEQFGNVTRVRLARSRRTGNSKGYAFVEFEYPEVAEVAAETMDNYLMFKQIVKAYYIPPEKQEFNYFRTSVKRIRNKSGKLVWVSGKTASIQQKMKKHNDWSEENYQKRTRKQFEKLKKIGQKYAHIGIDINEVIIQPQILKEKSKVKAIKKEEPTGSSKVIKRKIKENNSSDKDSSKKSKSSVSLEDLLGNTIQEDSEDEDYIAVDESKDNTDESEESSDEETYGVVKESDSEEQNNSANESEEEKDASLIFQKKSNKNFGKSLRASNVERFDQMLKRKPHTGGIIKINKKPLKRTSEVAKNKTALQVKAAKEMAKPLSKIKNKSNRLLKVKKTIKTK